MTLDSLPGLYLHIPFCSAVCPYCDFAVRRAAVPERKRFVQHLATEVALAACEWRDPRPFDTVYFGGGTPSLLPSEDLARVLDTCRTHLNLAEPWVFLEANPEDVTPDACATWRGLGVRTLSLGVQSFSDEALRFLGRRHTADEARAAVETALAAGFDTVSVDLIYGLPAQTEEVWRRDLATAVALGPGHLSCYQLTIHPRTRFGLSAARGQLSELPEGRQAALFDLTHRFLADAGWPAYEVSNFARSGEHQSRHNRKYWDHTPYLGLGPSAHSLCVADETTAPDAFTASDATTTAGAPPRPPPRACPPHRAEARRRPTPEPDSTGRPQSALDVHPAAGGTSGACRGGRVAWLQGSDPSRERKPSASGHWRRKR